MIMNPMYMRHDWCPRQKGDQLSNSAVAAHVHVQYVHLGFSYQGEDISYYTQPSALFQTENFYSCALVLEL
jgi:hypothetical protein